MAQNRTLLPGIAISLLLHAGLIVMVTAPKRPQPQPQLDTRRMLVWLTPPALPPMANPAEQAQPVPGAVAAAAPLRERARPGPAQRAPQTANADSTAATASATAPLAAGTTAASISAPAEGPAPAHASADARLPADPFAAAPAPVPGKFDVNAAMKSARKLATAKSTKDDPAVAQIYDKPLYGLPSDTPAGTAVGRTARADCKSVAAGTGILALVILPVMILTDKKDSGCKW
jgi:hypothetical protein